jgi:hypothetical protein
MISSLENRQLGVGRIGRFSSKGVAVFRLLMVSEGHSEKNASLTLFVEKRIGF